MTQTPTTPPNTPAGAHDGNGAARPAPWYHRPFFWLLAGLLIGALLVLLLLRGCQEIRPVTEPEPEPKQQAAGPSAEDRELDELILLQQAHNKGLEEEVRRLHGLLAEDPCTLSGILGPSPEKSPVAPSYEGPPAKSPPDRAPAHGSTSTAPGSSGESAGTSSTPPAATPPAAPETGPASPEQSVRPAPSAAPAPSTVGELMDKATVFVLSRHGEDFGMGSGFFVAPGIIATNSHVVQSPDADVIVGNKALGGMQEARIIAYSRDESRDYALLRIDNSLSGRAPVLQMAAGASRTERVSAWGFPGYIAEIDPKLEALAKGDVTAVPEVVYSEGVVSVVLDRTPPTILHTAALSQGNSGGPLVNAQGIVVGINTFIKTADKSYSQTNIALPGADLARFMRENGVAASVPAGQGE